MKHLHEMNTESRNSKNTQSNGVFLDEFPNIDNPNVSTASLHADDPMFIVFGQEVKPPSPQKKPQEKVDVFFM